MSSIQWLYIGVDVGGTNTDAVVLRMKEVLCSAKVPTTEDVTSGISEAIQSALSQLPEEYQPNPTQHVARVNIGTTHFVNAVVQRKFLTKVAVLRLCGPATRAIPPLCDFPADLRNVVGGMHFFLNGGFQYDCSCITDVDEEEVKRIANKVHSAGIRNAVIVGVFSPASKKQEVQVAEIIRSAHPDMSLTLSHEVGLIGLLERENAAVLNESLKPLCKKTVAAFCEALRTLGLKCPFYLTQNDGTIIRAEQALHLPVLTFASGPTNSMRGAAFLSGVQDAIVIDIGGTTTDVGVLKGGFPRQASARVKIGGVNTNFQMPDVLSVGLGGGSVIAQTQEAITVGPSSVAYKLMTEALVFGGKIITSTDIAVAFGLCEIGDKERTKDIPEVIKEGAMAEIKRKIEAAIDLVKFSGEDQPVILVGGGSVLVDLSQTLKGASKVFCPPNYQVANAVGAALSKVSGTFDHVVPLKNTTRENAWEEAERGARKRAVEAGADEQTLEVIDKEEVPLAYLPGNVVRFYLKVVGDLAECKANSIDELSEMGLKISSILSSEKLSPFKEVSEEAQQSSAQDEDAIVFRDPYVDPTTGDWILNKFDIECIAIGAGIMGCGGGGSPYLGRLRALDLIKNKKEIRVVHPNRLGSTPELRGNVITPAFMGAPVILIEKLFSGRESISAVEAASAILRAGGAINEHDNGDGIREAKDVQDWMSSKSELESKSKVVAVVCAEIGGANSIEPLVAGAELGLPIVDADGMGRAFPELQMFLPFVYDSLPYPAAVGDEKGNVVALTFAETPKHLEGFLRIKTVEMGCMVGFTFVLDWKDVQEKCALHTLSRTWRLGNTVLRARHNKASPVDSILQHENGKLLIVGKIADISRVTEGAFNKGKLNIEGSGKFIDQSLSIEFQNENYVAFVAKPDGTKSILATVPDLITLVDEDTGQPITTEEVRYGLRVAVVAMPCSSLWTTPQGLEVGGPVAFGYQDVVYSPVDSYEEHAPIPRA
ncbi:uncharacterized protein LOC111345029 [Stylophora pistillata]|uniref:uncharacterized protein LOC111345029 n=1 Tax=Stylophora pistillata TaxID=50429 RepID=UPI000C04E34F|nr:uncharacterized protein LOC111345029 [Stylophora pistillata]